MDSRLAYVCTPPRSQFPLLLRPAPASFHVLLHALTYVYLFPRSLAPGTRRCFFPESTRGFFFAFQRLLRFMSHGRRALAAQLLTPPVCVVWETLSWLGIGGTRAVGSSLIALGCVYSRGLAPQGLMRDWGLGGCVSAVLTLRRGRNCSS